MRGWKTKRTGRERRGLNAGEGEDERRGKELDRGVAEIGKEGKERVE